MSTKKKIWQGGVANIYITSTFNNTIVTVTDQQGNVRVWASAGSCGFKGTKKGTPYAAHIAAKTAARKALDIGVQKAQVLVKGIGPGRESAIRAVEAEGIDITALKDITPIPHNGCRPPKRRRV